MKLGLRAGSDSRAHAVTGGLHEACQAAALANFHTPLAWVLPDEATLEGETEARAVQS